MSKREQNLKAEALHWADCYKKADAANLETQKRYYLAKYNAVVKQLGYDPLV